LYASNQKLLREKKELENARQVQAAAIERLEQERAMAAAREVGVIRMDMDGLQQDDPERKCMGKYELMEGKVVNGRGVWHNPVEGHQGEQQYLYYVSGRIEAWWISDKVDTSHPTRSPRRG
jgi:hypothetical protein